MTEGKRHELEQEIATLQRTVLLLALVAFITLGVGIAGCVLVFPGLVTFVDDGDFTRAGMGMLFIALGGVGAIFLRKKAPDAQADLEEKRRELEKLE